MWVASRSVCLLFILVVCHILYSLYCLHSEGVGGGNNLWFQPIDPLCNHYSAPGMSMSIILPPCKHVAMATTKWCHGNKTLITKSAFSSVVACISSYTFSKMVWFHCVMHRFGLQPLVVSLPYLQSYCTAEAHSSAVADLVVRLLAMPSWYIQNIIIWTMVHAGTVTRCDRV